MEINKESELGKLLKKIIEEQGTSNNGEKIKEMTNEIGSLHKDTKFFKAILAAALALDKTTEFTESKNQRIPLFSLADIITGIVINFEKEGFIKIVKEEK